MLFLYKSSLTLNDKVLGGSSNSEDRKKGATFEKRQAKLLCLSDCFRAWTMIPRGRFDGLHIWECEDLCLADSTAPEFMARLEEPSLNTRGKATSEKLVGEKLTREKLATKMVKAEESSLCREELTSFPQPCKMPKASSQMKFKYELLKVQIMKR